MMIIMIFLPHRNIVYFLYGSDSLFDFIISLIHSSASRKLFKSVQREINWGSLFIFTWNNSPKISLDNHYRKKKNYVYVNCEFFSFPALSEMASNFVFCRCCKNLLNHLAQNWKFFTSRRRRRESIENCLINLNFCKQGEAVEVINRFADTLSLSLSSAMSALLSSLSSRCISAAGDGGYF